MKWRPNRWCKWMKLLPVADIIMLDNMAYELMKEAVDRIKSGSPHVIVEASGGVTLIRFMELRLAE